jgi:hypothetical protein
MPIRCPASDGCQSAVSIAACARGGKWNQHRIFAHGKMHAPVRANVLGRSFREQCDQPRIAS